MKHVHSTWDTSKTLTAILEATLDDILIADGEGTVLRTSAAFDKMYGIGADEIVGRSVYDLEKEGVFRPSITRQVLEQKCRVTMTQETQDGRKIVVSAVPVFDEQKQIKRVVSFSRDVTEYLDLQEEYRKLERKVELYTDRLLALSREQRPGAAFLGKSKEMLNTVALMDKVAKFDANVLLLGESGVGKTLFARMIHENSPRKKGELVEVNCGAIPESLMESELFGYEKGAFTGASQEGKAGLIELAHGGTLFLDEISELPLALQVKLLKVIQDKMITRVGGTRVTTVDFRLIAATNRNLEEMVSGKRFREDLYYRLNVISLRIPPLRERKEDLFGLAMYFLDRFNQKYGLTKSLSPRVADAISCYGWPGNVRELENLIERMVLTSDGDIIEIGTMPEALKSSHAPAGGSLKDVLCDLERKMVADAYQKHRTTIGVAEELGISQPTAVRKIQRYCIKEKRRI